jgi:hypothetical protein
MQQQQQEQQQQEQQQEEHSPTMKRNLLLCFDAFGTLFRPRSPIAEQYGSIARSMGVKITDEQVAASFKSGKCHTPFFFFSFFFFFLLLLPL